MSFGVEDGAAYDLEVVGALPRHPRALPYLVVVSRSGHGASAIPLPIWNESLSEPERTLTFGP